ncbi:hypothetical protein C0992_005515 [Termitomyces sp. T32_za158]|nr:hypothetical protein C0992_005515 [Termitomyces sp. T32_za158]
MSRIALLVTGALPAFGDYHAVFTAFLAAAAPGHEFELVAYDVVHKMEYPSDDELGSFDALMYTGSASNAFDDAEWITTLVAFTARVVDEHPRLKLIGICFGHQIIARALGGSCVRNTRWEIGPTPLDLTPLGKSLFGVDTLTIQQMHRDHVPFLPSTLDLLASTPTSPIQGFVRFFPSSAPTHTLANIHIFSVQGHPEFTEPIVSHLVAARAQSGIVPPDVAADYENRRNWANDGVGVVGRAVWRVLGVEVGQG